MKKLLKYLKFYKKESILGPLFKLLEASLELLVPLVVAAIIDTGIKNSNKPFILKYCLLLVLLGAVGLICSVTAQFFAAKAAVGFTAKIRLLLFSHIEKLSYSQLDNIGTSTLITRLTTDMNQVQSGVNLTLRLLLRSPFVVFGAMAMAFTIDFNAALIFVVAIPLLSAAVFSIMLISIPLYKKVQQALDKVLGITRESLNSVRIIRAFCKEESEITEFNASNRILTKIQTGVGKISSLMNPITFVIINAAVIILIYTGALRVEYGFITQGAVVALYNYMSQILIELIKLANLIINITKSVASGNRIQSILEINPDLKGGTVTSGKASSLYSVEFNNVSMRYQNAGDNSLENINFKAKRGETIGIIGGTGSGKTSLVNLIPKFYETESGEVLVDGINVNEYSLETLRHKIGVVPQKAILFKGTIRENMQWGCPDSSDEEIFKALDIAQASEIVNKKPGGLDFVIEQGGRNFSGGQKQRLCIARAIVGCPEILILDDSSSALDFATDAALRTAIKSMTFKPTVFIVSQRASSIQHADKIIVLDDGKSVGTGTAPELLKSCDVYREIYNSQFKKESDI